MNSYTKEKIYIVAGPEFGPALAGRTLIIVEALYRLRTSTARLHKQLTDTLQKLGVSPSKADPKMFYKDVGDHYECIAIYIDDILVWSCDPMQIMKLLMTDYTMKGVVIPEYYLGGNVKQLQEEWLRENIQIGILAKTYIKNVIPKFKKLLGKVLSGYNTHMEEKYHPELEDSALCEEREGERERERRVYTGSLLEALTGPSPWEDLMCTRQPIP